MAKKTLTGGWVGVGCWRWVGGWEQMRIRLTSASTGVGVEVGAELCNNKIRKVRQANLTGRVFNYTLSP